MKDKEVYVIGGAMMYHTLLPYCDTAYITKVEDDGGATVFFDNLDNLQEWALVEESETVEDNGHNITFCTYRNSNPLQFVSTIDKNKKGVPFEKFADKFNNL